MTDQVPPLHEADGGNRMALSRRSRRLKSYTLLAALALSGLTLLAWTGEWFSIRLSAAATTKVALSVTGDVAAPALVALALASLALVAALAIAGPVIRVVLGVIQSVIGATVAFTAFIANADPITASAPAISAVTGVSGSNSVRALVETYSAGVWPILAIVAGVLSAILGIFIVVSGRRWPTGSDRYQQPKKAEKAVPGANAVTDWDTLSGGDDPTSR